MRNRAWNRAVHALVLAVGISTACPLAWAQQPSVSKAALAESLFSEGRQLMKEGKYAEACDKFAESQRLDPGLGTQLNLAVCNEKLGKTATAWALFSEIAAAASREGRQRKAEFARNGMARLQSQLSYLSVMVSDENRVPGLTILLDGVSLGGAAWGTKMPIDPGHHLIEAKAAGYQTWKTSAYVPPVSGHVVIHVQKLHPVPAPPPKKTPPPSKTGPSTKPKPVAPPPAPPAKVPPPVAETGSAQATWGYVLGSLGVVALGVGSYFGLRAFSTWNRHLEHCPNNVCDKEGSALGRDTDMYATSANIAIGAGSAVLVLGSLLVLTAPSSAPSREVSSPGTDVTVGFGLASGTRGAGLEVGGVW